MVTGHSLGAGVASLLAGLWAGILLDDGTTPAGSGESNDSSRSTSEGEGSFGAEELATATAYGYAPPCVLSLDLKEEMVGVVHSAILWYPPL